MIKNSAMVVVTLIIPVLLLVGCELHRQLDSAGGPTGSTAVNAGVAMLSPSESLLAAGKRQQFRAPPEVSDPSLVWCVDGIPGGDPELGVIDQNGLFQAPWMCDHAVTRTVTAYSLAAPDRAVLSAQVMIEKSQ